MKKGFTMIEVIIVIGIIAILTVVIFPSISQIRAKNRDTERVSDLSSLQLGLSLYYSQHPDKGYPLSLTQDTFKSYVPNDSLYGPDGKLYTYIPLKVGSGSKCTYYHLGAVLELSSSQINANDTFDSSNLIAISNGYKYCGDDATKPPNGIAPPNLISNPKLLNYNVLPL